MLEYRDIMAQLKYPGVSKCMSEIYMATNMDDIHYSQDSLENAAQETEFAPVHRDIPR